MNAERYAGKRFALAALCAILLTVAFFFGADTPDGVSKFGNFAMYIAGIFTVYCTGQSFTDNTKFKNGGGQHNV